jgi:pyruvate dehydrogenase E1 component alpha subunit
MITTNTVTQSNLFQEYDPLSDKTFQVMDSNGNIVNPGFKPDISDEKILEALKTILFMRATDLKAVSYQRQGRMFTYPPNLGQEAVSVGMGMIMKQEDWLVPAYREMGAWIAKGASLKEIFLYNTGNEFGAQFASAPHMLSITVPIATQIPHAAGIGYALKYKKQPGVIFTFFGDGATSKGDFHEGVNLAATWGAPVVFTCQNNQYAISFPVSKQTKSKSIAIKAVAYGIKGIRVDGNDLLAMYATGLAAREYAQSGKGPVLIEAVTYRLGAHTTSDDPKRYRSPEEEKDWKEKDPVKRLRTYLVSRSLWNEQQEEALIKQYNKQIDDEFSKVEVIPYNIEDAFKYHYKETPEILKKQKADYERFLSWKETKQ